ncbi:reverse transcriptase family protein [Bacillus haynesii]|uniref:reverse transcriptase family protein n=1 Tax=Bacillus haynesii TaxID=1925021 RepID=UPI003B987E85
MNIFDIDYFYNNVLKSNDLNDLTVSKEEAYKEFTISKNSKKRVIKTIEKNSKLYNLQMNLYKNFLNSIELPDCVFGFVKGRSYRDYLLPHKKNCSEEERFYLRLDIKDFFDNITETLIQESLIEYINLNDLTKKEKILSDIVKITTYNGTLPQGAITSPVLSNIVFRKADLRIRKYCQKMGYVYSRYADDLLFSSSSEKLMKRNIIILLRSILSDLGFELNNKKILKYRNYISINGFVISDHVSISRSKLADLNKFLFLFEKKNKDSAINCVLTRVNSMGSYRNRYYFTSKASMLDYLAGYRSFLISWLTHEEDSWNNKCVQLIKRIEKAIEKINKIKL